MKKLTFIDLFSGCGGFSLGMERAGFGCLAAVDFNREAIAWTHQFRIIGNAVPPLVSEAVGNPALN